MCGSFVNIPSTEGSELNSELLPAGAKRKGGLQSALSEKEWGQRLDPPSRKAIEVERKPSEVYYKVFPGVPFFAIGSKTFFVVPDNFDGQETVATTICAVRDKGPRPRQSDKGHWISPHYAVNLDGAPEKFQDTEATDKLPGHLIPTSPTPSLDNKSYRPYPARHPISDDKLATDMLPSSRKDPAHAPDWRYTRLYTHKIPVEPNQYDVEVTQLKVVLDAAELADYKFALRMQGLQTERSGRARERHAGSMGTHGFTHSWINKGR